MDLRLSRAAAMGLRFLLARLRRLPRTSASAGPLASGANPATRRLQYDLSDAGKVAVSSRRPDVVAEAPSRSVAHAGVRLGWGCVTIVVGVVPTRLDRRTRRASVRVLLAAATGSGCSGRACSGT